MNIFDIIGPIMTGPSSSHTAGAVKVDMLLCVYLKTDKDNRLYNSFSKTGRTWYR